MYRFTIKYIAKRGDKALIGNAGYRRYLRKTATAKGQPAFEIKLTLLGPVTPA